MSPGAVVSCVNLGVDVEIYEILVTSVDYSQNETLVEVKTTTPSLLRIMHGKCRAGSNDHSCIGQQTHSLNNEVYYHDNLEEMLFLFYVSL